MSVKKFIPVVSIGAILLAAGFVIGAAIRVDWSAVLATLPIGKVNQPDDHGDHGDHEVQDGHEDVVALSAEAYKNLGISLGSVRLSDYQRTLRVPGEVIEKPGHSDHSLVAPVTGVISRFYASAGQAVRVGDPLFKMQVIDESLMDAQIKLLEALTRLEVVDAELRRLTPLAESGTIVGRKKLELEYERKELLARQSTRRQELAARGLNDSQIENIVDQRKLLREITIRMPDQLAGHATRVTPVVASTDPSVASESSTGSVGDGLDYTIEAFHITPGQAVQRGDTLAHLAYHTSLFIEGAAFEAEIDNISAIGSRDATVKAEFGAAVESFTRGGLKILYVDNRVDPKTQTFRFYVPLRNEVVRDAVDDDGDVYRTWRFKPGQRVHLIVPLETLVDQMKLPLSAVTQQGAEAFVFRVFTHDENDEDHSDNHDHAEDEHDHEGHDHHGHDHEYVIMEFKAIPVHIVHRDLRFVVISQSGKLKRGDVIAMRGAYQLALTLQRQAGGGGGHGHDHPH